MAKMKKMFVVTGVTRVVIFSNTIKLKMRAIIFMDKFRISPEQINILS